MDHRNTPAFATVDEGTMERSDNSITGESPAYLGLDVGAVSLALVLIDGGGNILDTMYCLVNEDGDVPGRASGHHCIQSCAACELPCNSTFIVEKTGQFTDSGDRKFKVRVDGFIATGSQVHKGIPFPVPLDRLVSEISAHSRGMHHASNTENVEAIIDVGGQDSKVIRLSSLIDFQMSGLCAAGTGAYLDEISRVEQMSVSEFGDIGGRYIERYLNSLGDDEPLPLEEFSSICTVFTKSSYVKKKGSLTLPERVAAICWAQAKQIYNTVMPNLRDYSGRVSFQGGVSFNSGVRLGLDHLLKKGWKLSDDSPPVLVVPELRDYRDQAGRSKPVSHLMGALGAALLARENKGIAAAQAITEPKTCPPLSSDRLRKDLLKKQIGISLQKGPSRPRIAWSGTLFPSEICYLFDIVPLALPLLAAIDHKNAQENLLTASKEEGVDRATCTILSAVLGRFDRTPEPDFIFHTSGSCDYYRQHMLRVIDRAHQRFGLDPQRQVCTLDLPTFTFDNQTGIDFLAAQLRQAVTRIEETLGVRHDPDKLREIIENTNQARRYHVLTEELRANNPALALGSELLKRAALYSTGWGSREFVDITRSYHEELAQRARLLSPGESPLFSLKEKHRILWLYLWDYNDSSIFEALEGELDCAIVAEELNHIHWPEMDPEHPFESIARRIVQPINHINSRMSYVREMAETYRVDGIILFAHFFGHCPLASESIQHLLRRSGYPTLFLDGDCLDDTRRSSSTITKVQAFVEQLNLKRYGNIFGVNPPETSVN